MALEIIKNIDVDFYNKEYILINAKQYDANSRVISITCYNQGELMRLSDSQHSAYVRYRKADGHPVLNSCRINNRGQVLVELTEQMLIASGVCYVDLIIINKGDALVNTDTGEILAIDDSPILSTMAFYVNAYEAAVDNSEVESSYEYEGLNDLMQRAEADYKEVIQLSRSYAIGDANDIRENEDYDNSKYYSRLSRSYAIGDAGNVRRNENVDNSKYYSEQSSDSADASKSYAIGGTGTRSDEDTDNSQYYSQMSKSYAMGGTGLEARDGEDIDNAEYYSRLSMSYAKGGTNIAERNSDGENENIDNAEYYSRLAKSYTVGSFDGDTGTRSDESTENAKTYMETAKSHMDTTESYMNKTEEYMDTTEGFMNTTDGHMKTTEGYMNAVDGYMKTTQGYMETTEGYMETTDGYMDKTEEFMNTTNGYMGVTQGYMETTRGHMETSQEYMETAKSHMDNAETYMNNAEISMNNAKASETNASVSEANAKASENNASTSENNAYDYLVTTQRYTVGGTGTVSGEDVDNAKYYYQQVKGIQDSISGALSPQRTVSFEELATVEKFTGYMYLIDESFTTDATFTDGEGVQYPAGTLVFYTSNGLWSCLDSFGSSVATVDEVVEYLGLLM